MSFIRRLFGGQRSQVRELDAFMLAPERADAVLPIVGEASYQPALAKVAGGKTPDGPLRPDHTAGLLLEPTNRYDRNAVRVDIEGRRVGYLSRENAVAYGPVLRWAAARGHAIAAEARIIGGWDRGGGDVGDFGVVLRAGSPAETFLELLGDQLPVRTDHRWAGRLVAFTGDSTCRIQGIGIDRGAAVLLATRAGMTVHPRVTKKVQLLVDCDSSGTSGNEARALDYGIEIVTEPEFWQEIGIPVERIEWHAARFRTAPG